MSLRSETTLPALCTFLLDSHFIIAMKTCFVLMILSGLGVAGVLGRANLTERCKRVYDELPPTAFVTDIQANYRLTYPSSSVYTIKQSIRQSADTMDGRAFIEVIQGI